MLSTIGRVMLAFFRKTKRFPNNSPFHQPLVNRRLLPMRLLLGGVVTMTLCGQVSAAGKRILQFGLSGKQFQKDFDVNVKAGYRLIDVATSYAKGQPRVAVIYEKGVTKAWHAGAAYSEQDLREKIVSRAEDGFRVIHLSGTIAGGKPQYSAIWEKSESPPPELRFGLSPDEFEKAHRQLTETGHQLSRIAAFAFNGATRYAGLWERKVDRPRELRLRLSSTQVRREVRQMAEKGYRVVSLCGYAENRRVRFAGIWEAGIGPKQLVTENLTAVSLEKTVKKMALDGYDPAQISTFTFGDRDRYVVVWELLDE